MKLNKLIEGLTAHANEYPMDANDLNVLLVDPCDPEKHVPINLTYFTTEHGSETKPSVVLAFVYKPEPNTFGILSNGDMFVLRDNPKYVLKKVNAGYAVYYPEHRPAVEVALSRTTVIIPIGLTG
ncbi:MAG: hypothetical protein [Bacteriophage sp.]|nr:MAG: hypothetical protein [Bacteriophage sp.]